MDFTYAIGSKIVHPCYGAGRIVRVQEKSIGELTNAYYVIHTIARSMDLMVPVSRAESVGLRSVGKAEHLRRCLAVCSVLPAQGEIDPDLRSRQTEMREQLKTGAYGVIAQITRQLYYLNNRRPLGTVDRQIYDQAKEFLASELALALDVAMEVALREVEDTLQAMFGDDED